MKSVGSSSPTNPVVSTEPSTPPGFSSRAPPLPLPPHSPLPLKEKVFFPSSSDPLPKAAGPWPCVQPAWPRGSWELKAVAHGWITIQLPPGVISGMGKGAAMPPEERKTERSQRTQSKPIFTPALNISGSVAQTKHEIRDKEQEVAAVEAEATKQQDHGQYQQVPGTATAAPWTVPASNRDSNCSTMGSTFEYHGQYCGQNHGQQLQVQGQHQKYQGQFQQCPGQHL